MICAMNVAEKRVEELEGICEGESAHWATSAEERIATKERPPERIVRRRASGGLLFHRRRRRPYAMLIVQLNVY